MSEKKPSQVHREVDMFDAAANERLHKQDRDPVRRCRVMASDLAAIAARLAAPIDRDDVEEASRRARYEATVARMWAAYMNEPPGEWGPIVAIGKAVELAAQTYAGKWMAEACSTFVLWLTTTSQNGHSGLTSAVRPFVEDAIKAWRRPPGAPKAKDRDAPKKWQAFAALVEAMGYGHVEPDDLKREYARQAGAAVKKGRKARH